MAFIRPLADDPVIGRWESVDPMAENYVDQSPYNYVANNPLMYNDPTGMDANGWIKGADGKLFWDANINSQSDFNNSAYGSMVGYSFMGMSGRGVNENTGQWLQYTNQGQVIPMATPMLAEAYVPAPFKSNPAYMPWMGPSLHELQIGLDLAGSTEIPVYSQAADVGSGLISLYHRDYTGAGISVAGTIIPGLSQTKLARTVAKEAKQLLLVADKLHRHHVFPQQFRSWFAKRGISNIDDYTVEISRQTHLKGVHGKGIGNLPGQWNQKWSEFIKSNPNASPSEIFHYAEGLLDRYGLEHSNYVKYK